jgi:hypothetical protein
MRREIVAAEPIDEQTAFGIRLIRRLELPDRSDRRAAGRKGKRRSIAKAFRSRTCAIDRADQSRA